MYLNHFEEHFSYIKDLRSYRKRFSCRKCGNLWKSCWALQRHERTCEANVRYSYLEGYTIPTNAFLKRYRGIRYRYSRRPQVLPIQGNVQHRSHAGAYRLIIADGVSTAPVRYLNLWCGL